LPVGQGGVVPAHARTPAAAPAHTAEQAGGARIAAPGEGRPAADAPSFAAPQPTVDPAQQQPVPPMVAPNLQPRVEVEEEPARRAGADGEPVSVVKLAFNSPTLGRLDLRLELRGERILAEVTTPAGRPHAVASGGAERLRAKLEAVGLEATVNVRPRSAPLDLYA
jgi:hypothetical protein